MRRFQLIDPSRTALRSPRSGCDVALVGVYRGDGAVVRELLAGLPADATVRLWSLDDQIPDSLAALTVGAGPGTRFTLLNRLIATIPFDSRRDALVVVDDDVRFDVGDVARLVGTGMRLGYDIYQPAHVADSQVNWRFVRRRSLTVARDTDFVEQGPLLVLSGRAQQHLLPLPEDMGMGWGVEVRWWAAAQHHALRMGIIDAAAVSHLVPTAGGYDRPAQQAILDAEVARGGLTDLGDLHRRQRLLRWPYGWWIVHRGRSRRPTTVAE